MKKVFIILILALTGFSTIYSQPLWHLGEDSYVADDTTYIRMYRYSIASTYRDTLPELNVVYEASYYRTLPHFRVDTIIVPDAWEASERLTFLTDYYIISKVQQDSILSYLQESYMPMERIVEVLSFELPPVELRGYFEGYFDFDKDNTQVLDSVKLLAPRTY